ncbi:MAG: hypothetical protein FJ255_05730 [Phycisphaerae bacterium]|nr:hypothetical protein [Phycisphaerae bacterium]
MGPTTEQSRATLALVGRLRLAQADLADLPAAERRRVLKDELERAVSGAAPGDRRALLDDLLAYFPVFGAGASSASPGPRDDGSAAALAEAERRLNDPVALAERLGTMSAGLSAEQRKAVSAALAAGGFSGGGGTGALPEGVDKDLRQRLKIAADKPIDPARLLAAAGMLAVTAQAIDQTVWPQWKDLAPRSNVRGGVLSSVLSRYLTNDAAVTSSALGHELSSTQRMVAVMLAATKRAGRQFAQRHLMKFSPASIEEAAKPKKSLMEAFGVTCWRHYAELMGQHDETVIEGDLRQAIAEQAESLMEAVAKPGR